MRSSVKQAAMTPSGRGRRLRYGSSKGSRVKVHCLRPVWPSPNVNMAIIPPQR